VGQIFTLRGLDEETTALLRAEADRQGTSMNSLVLDYVRRGLGVAKPRRPRYHDLDNFFGSWSAQEADAFLESLRDFEVIDQDEWHSPVDAT
jgi:hypothetical protein